MFESGPLAQVVCGKDKHTKTEPFFARQSFTASSGLKWGLVWRLKPPGPQKKHFLLLCLDYFLGIPLKTCSVFWSLAVGTAGWELWWQFVFLGENCSLGSLQPAHGQFEFHLESCSPHQSTKLSDTFILWELYNLWNPFVNRSVVVE